MADYWVERDGQRLGPFDEARIFDDWVSVEEAFAHLPEPKGTSESFQLTPLELPPERQPEPVTTGESGFQTAPEDPLAYSRASRDYSFHYAGFWVRYGALTIDNVVNLALSSLFILVLVILCGLMGIQLRYDDSRFNVFSLLIGWLYYAGLEGGRYSATLGKRAFNLQVLRAESLQAFGFFLGSARFAVSIVSALLFLIGYLMQPFTPRKQALHDMATGTVVVVQAPYSRLLLGIIIAIGILVPIAALLAVLVTIGTQAGYL